MNAGRVTHQGCIHVACRQNGYNCYAALKGLAIFQMLLNRLRYSSLRRSILVDHVLISFATDLQSCLSAHIYTL